MTPAKVFLWLKYITGVGSHISTNCRVKNSYILNELCSLFIECVDRLGMQNGDIKDSQITASSSRPADLPHYGRLHNGKYWCPAKANKNEHFQVDFSQVRKSKRNDYNIQFAEQLLEVVTTKPTKTKSNLLFPQLPKHVLHCKLQHERVAKCTLGYNMFYCLALEAIVAQKNALRN